MINIDSRSSKPIYEQIIDEIKENILRNILKPGDKLPSVRELSSMITVNPNTVSKAYLELERQEVIETLRGKGTYVSMGYKPKLDEDKLSRFKENIKKLLIEGHYMGLNRQAIIEIMDSIYSTIEGE